MAEDEMVGWHLFGVLVLEDLVGLHRTIQLHSDENNITTQN